MDQQITEQITYAEDFLRELENLTFIGDIDLTCILDALGCAGYQLMPAVNGVNNVSIPTLGLFKLLTDAKTKAQA